MKLKKLLVTGALMLGAGGAQAEVIDIAKVNETIKEIIKDVVAADDDKISSLALEFAPEGTSIEQGKIQGSLSAGLHYTPWSKEKNQAAALNFKAQMLPNADSTAYLVDAGLSLAARTPTLDLFKFAAKKALESADQASGEDELRIKEEVIKLSQTTTFDLAARQLKVIYDLLIQRYPQEGWALKLDEVDGNVTKIALKIVWGQGGEEGLVTALFTADANKIEGGVKVKDAPIDISAAQEIQQTIKDFFTGISEGDAEVIETTKEIAAGFVQTVKLLVYGEE